MGNFQIFGLQFVLSIIVYALVIQWYGLRWLAAMPLRNAVMLLVLPHLLFRHVGMTFLSTAVVSSELPRSFAAQIGYGDLLAQALALISIVALRAMWGIAWGAVWTFNIVGSVDLLNALYRGIQLDAPRYQIGAAWYIPTFGVPFLLVTHYLIFAALLRRPRAAT